jgi:hypothetical protein
MREGQERRGSTLVHRHLSMLAARESRRTIETADVIELS